MQSRKLAHGLWVISLNRYGVNWMALFGCGELINIGGGFVAIGRQMKEQLV